MDGMVDDWAPSRLAPIRRKKIGVKTGVSAHVKMRCARRFIARIHHERSRPTNDRQKVVGENVGERRAGVARVATR